MQLESKYSMSRSSFCTRAIKFHGLLSMLLVCGLFWLLFHIYFLCFYRKKVRERRRKLLLLCRHQLCGLSIQISLRVTTMSCSLWMTSKVNLLNFEWSFIISLSPLLVDMLNIAVFCLHLAVAHFLICFITHVRIGFILVGADFDVSFH